MSNNNKKYFIKVTAVTRSEALAYCGNRGMQLYRYENKDLTNYAWFFGVGKFQNLLGWYLNLNRSSTFQEPLGCRKETLTQICVKRSMLWERRIK